MSDFKIDPNARVIYDGLESMIHGVGDPNRDKAASVYFGQKVIPDQQLENAYESNWMARNLVDIPVMDSLRRGWRWEGDAHEIIEDEERRLNLAGNLMKAFKKGRLFGGAALYIGTDQKPETPLDIDAIDVGGVKYLNMMTRKQLNAGEIDTDPLSEHYGLPKEYIVSSTQNGTVTIHPSRLALFFGDERSDNVYRPSSTGWPGSSVLQSTHDAIANAQGSHSSVASLIYEANIDMLGIPDLMDNIGRQGYESELIKRFRLFAQAKGVTGMGVMDSKETLDRKSASFANLSQLMETFAIFVAASGQIPATRFLAQSPSGLVSTGESDMKNYYDLIQSKQKLEINPATALLFASVRKSATGESKPILRVWEPLEQMSVIELAKLGKDTAETVKAMVETGGFNSADARALLTAKLAENGSFPHIENILSEVLGPLDIEPPPESV